MTAPRLSRHAHPRAWWRGLAATALALCALTPTLATGQEQRSGALDFGGGLAFSHDDRAAFILHARAMAVDRVPDTIVGRFGELYGHVGADFSGDLVLYSARIKLGVGVATPYFVAFAASGIMVDAYQAVDDAGQADTVEPGVAFPLVLGLWIDPVPGFYVYAMAEPSWVWGVEARQTSLWPPFGIAEELKLRAGVGFDVADLHLRFTYTMHFVEPSPWHLFTIGTGTSAAAASSIGEPRK